MRKLAGATASISPVERAYAALMARAAHSGPLAHEAAAQAGAMAINRDPVRAQKAYERAAALDSSDALSRLALARLAIERDELAIARDHAAAAFSCAAEPGLRGLAALALGEIAALRGDAGEAHDACAAALALFEEAEALAPDNIEARRHSARARQRLADLEPDPAAREQAHIAALSDLEALPLDQCSAGLWEDVAFGCGRLAALAQDRKDFNAARKLWARKRVALERLMAQEPDEIVWAGETADAWRMETRFAVDAGDLSGARDAAEKAVRLLVKAAAQDPLSGDRSFTLACAWIDLAETERPRPAAAACAQADGLLTRLAEAAPQSPAITLERARIALARAMLAMQANALEEARKTAAEACKALDPLAASGSQAALPLLSRAWALLGDIAARADRLDQACDATARAIAIDARCGGVRAAPLYATLAQACETLGDVDAARKAHAACCDAWLMRLNQTPDRRDPLMEAARALMRAGDFASGTGDPRAAAQSWRDAIELSNVAQEFEDGLEILRMRARLAARLALSRERDAGAHRGRALSLYEDLARRSGLTAEDVEIHARLLSG